MALAHEKIEVDPASSGGGGATIRYHGAARFSPPWDVRPTNSIDRPSPHPSPRDILTLARCPTCDYDLSGLPPRYRCPECGLEYDESMFLLDGWSVTEDSHALTRWFLSRSRGTRVRAVLQTVPGLILLVIVGAWVLPRGGWSLTAVWVVVAVVSVLWNARRLLSARREGRGTIRWVFSSRGACRRQPDGRLPWIPWGSFSELRFRRLRRGAWRMELLADHLGIYLYEGAPYPLVGGARIRAVVELTPREAALVRHEIRRRMHRASRANIVVPA